MCKLTPEAMLTALYVLYDFKSALHSLLQRDDLAVYQVGPVLKRQTYGKIKPDSAFLLGTFVLVRAAFRHEAVLLHIVV